MQARSTSHEKALERPVVGQGHHELKLAAARSRLERGQHQLRYLLVKVLLTMHHLQPEQVTVKTERSLQIRDCNSYMIKTE